eukprot:CAMPEP_0171319118 /NCGR_PEP_ID=MMETSP0816-20121228/93895_1 /TAXON_ID=420281 /ORGANISM="Proboscia inermis, Strain CCAP1064/1" /LENGTH=31 /DNA_ID= /DNA_START= /DNA_END= /DNA_ORIENTATION=
MPNTWRETMKSPVVEGVVDGKVLTNGGEDIS